MRKGPGDCRDPGENDCDGLWAKPSRTPRATYAAVKTVRDPLTIGEGEPICDHSAQYVAGDSGSTEYQQRNSDRRVAAADYQPRHRRYVGIDEELAALHEQPYDDHSHHGGFRRTRRKSLALTVDDFWMLGTNAAMPTPAIAARTAMKTKVQRHDATPAMKVARGTPVTVATVNLPQTTARALPRLSGGASAEPAALASGTKAAADSAMRTRTAIIRP
jgi:hypothetical protein